MSKTLNNIVSLLILPFGTLVFVLRVCQAASICFGVFCKTIGKKSSGLRKHIVLLKPFEKFLIVDPDISNPLTLSVIYSITILLLVLNAYNLDLVGI